MPTLPTSVPPPTLSGSTATSQQYRDLMGAVASTPPAPEAFPPANGRRPTALCAATTTAGRPCRFPPRLNSTLCINHDPAYHDQQTRNRQTGVRHAARNRHNHATIRETTALYELDAWALSDRASIQAVLDAVIRLELAGRIPNSRARNLIRALALAIRNFDTPPASDQLGRVSRHNLSRYHHARRSLDNNLEALLTEAQRNDAARQEPQHP